MMKLLQLLILVVSVFLSRMEFGHHHHHFFSETSQTAISTQTSVASADDSEDSNHTHEADAPGHQCHLSCGHPVLAIQGSLEIDLAQTPDKKNYSLDAFLYADPFLDSLIEPPKSV